MAPTVATSDRETAIDFTGVVPKALHWYRVSAERALLYAQIYRFACATVRNEAVRLREPWGVILDADETILDNTEFQIRLTAETEGEWDAEAQELWRAWVRERRAPLLPGVKPFVDTVHHLGGKVFIVTNREESLCDDTRWNLEANGLVIDGIFCQTDSRDKDPRFKGITDGSLSGSAVPYRILAYIGDNIEDFPMMSQQSRDGSKFGKTYFLLPNPMYGSYEQVPFR